MYAISSTTRLTLTAALGALMACGGDDTQTLDPVVGSEGSVYAISSVPSTTAGAPTISYIILTESLVGEKLPADAVLEVEGRALLASMPSTQQLFVGSPSSGVVTRYDLVDGNLSESGTVNFAAQQVTAISGYSSQLMIVSPTKGYWIGRDGRIVVWNPTAMTVDAGVDIPGMIREDPNNPGTNYTTSVSGAPLQVGTTIYQFVSWDSRGGGVVTIPGSYGVIALDTTTDTVNLYLDESGCGYGRDAVFSGNYLYIATEAVGTSVNYLNPDNGPAPCLTRFDVTTNTFDTAFTKDLNALAGGPTGSMVITEDGEALVHVLDTAAADPLIADGTYTNPRALSSASLWHAVRLEVGDSPSVVDLGLPAGPASALPVSLGDGLRVTQVSGTPAYIREITRDGVVATDRADATVSGFTAGIVRLR